MKDENMRVFFAILPDQKTKIKLQEMSRKMHVKSRSGNFTSVDNFHVTLVFIGDVSDTTLVKLKAIVDETKYAQFVIKTRNLGFFSNRGSKDILVWHIERNQELDGLSDFLREKLEKLGFEFQDREFRPHFTIARKVAFPPEETNDDDFYRAPVVFMRCERLSLMESRRINGKLSYREVHGKNLETIPERKLQ